MTLPADTIFNQRVWIDYINYRGERAWRFIAPKELVFDRNEWHPEPQWLLTAWDVEKKAPRTFAMRNILHWVPPGESVSVYDDNGKVFIVKDGKVIGAQG